MAYDHKGHDNSRSTSPQGDGTDDDNVADSTDDTPKVDEHQDSGDPTVVVPNSSNVESTKTGSGVDGSTSPGSHNSSESEEEVVTVQKTARTKKMPRSTSTSRDAKTDAPGPSQPTSDADKVSEVELRNQQHQDA